MFQVRQEQPVPAAIYPRNNLNEHEMAEVCSRRARVNGGQCIRTRYPREPGDVNRPGGIAHHKLTLWSCKKRRRQHPKTHHQPGNNDWPAAICVTRSGAGISEDKSISTANVNTNFLRLAVGHKRSVC